MTTRVLVLVHLCLCVAPSPAGHGVSIGSETSGWVRNVTIRDSVLDGTNLAVRIKSMRGRGGGVEDVLYQNLTGSVVSAIQLTLNCKSRPTPPKRGPRVPNVPLAEWCFLQL